LPQNLEKLGAFAFFGTAITSITLPPKLTMIEGGTFRFCKNLTSIVIPEGVIEIGRDDRMGGGAFSGCTALTSVTFPSTIKKISTQAFEDCSALITITIPDTVETIEMGYGDGAPFAGCSKVNLASQARLKRLGYTGKF
jgi:hypothetical protein